MYADDTVIFYSSDSVEDIEKTINAEAEILNLWIKENCLVLNLKKNKTEFVLYGCKKTKSKCNIIVDQTTINQPHSYEYLGVTLDKALNLSDHFTQTSKKIGSRIRLLHKIRH